MNIAEFTVYSNFAKTGARITHLCNKIKTTYTRVEDLLVDAAALGSLTNGLVDVANSSFVTSDGVSWGEVDVDGFRVATIEIVTA